MSKQQLIEEVFGKDANLYTDAFRVDINASPEEIEKAYLKQWKDARQKLVSGLPAKETKEAQKRLEALLIAYRILSNPELRSKYNEMMTEASSSSGSEVSDEKRSPTSSRKQYQQKTPGSPPKLTYSARDVRRARLNRNNGSENPANTLQENSDKTIVHAFENFPDFPDIPFESNSRAGSTSFYSTSTQDLGRNIKQADTDEDVFADLDESWDLNNSFMSQMTSDVKHQSSPGNKSNDTTIVHNVTEETFDESEDEDSVSSRTHSSKKSSRSSYSRTSKNSRHSRSSRNSSSRSGRYPNMSEKKHYRHKKMSPSSVARYEDERSGKKVDVEDDASTIDDNSTVGSTTIEGNNTDDESIRYVDVDSPCLDMMCVPTKKKIALHQMLTDLKTEIKGSIDDTVSAVDQVFNAFTIQPEEFSGLVNKIETEKQTLMFSSEFMQLAQIERQKRLETSKRK